jgi:hypothetical protein
VGRDEDDGRGRSDGSEVLEFGTTRWPARHRPAWLGRAGRWLAGLRPARRWPARLAVGLLAVLLAGAAVGYGHRAHGRPGGARPAGQADRAAGQAIPPVVQVTTTGHRLLGMSPGWDLVGLGPGSMVDIQPGRGRIIQTAVPLDSTGPVSLVAAPEAAVIRPLDFVPGYLVPAGQPPRSLPAPLSQGGVAVPGPRPGLVWMVAPERHQMSLYSLAAQATIRSVPLPRDAWQASPDGRGGVWLQTDQGRSYDAGLGGARPVTAGMVAAVGPAGWLVVQCRPGGGPCADVLIDPTTGKRWPLAGPVVATDGSAGVIAPDGAAAALFASGAGEHDLLQLVNLGSGCITTLPVTVQGPLGSRDLAWSPDSRWLFTVADNGQLRAIDVRTGLVHRLGVSLPPLTDLAATGTR